MKKTTCTLSVDRLQKLWSFDENFSIWHYLETPISNEEIHQAIADERLRDFPLPNSFEGDAESWRIIHVERIAHFASKGWKSPKDDDQPIHIDVDAGIVDGSLRYRAAVYRCDRTIEAVVSGSRQLIDLLLADPHEQPSQFQKRIMPEDLINKPLQPKWFNTPGALEVLASTAVMELRHYDPNIRYIWGLYEEKQISKEQMDCAVIRYLYSSKRNSYMKQHLDAIPTIPTIPAFPDELNPNPFNRLAIEGFRTFRMVNPLTISLDPNPDWIDTKERLPEPMVVVDLRVGDRILRQVYRSNVMVNGRRDIVWLNVSQGKQVQIDDGEQVFWRETQG